MIRRPPRSTLFPTRRSSDLSTLLLFTDGLFERRTMLLDEGRDLLRDLVGRSAGLPLDVLCNRDRKSTRLNSSHANISYAVFCLKKKHKHAILTPIQTLYRTS